MVAMSMTKRLTSTYRHQTEQAKPAAPIAESAAAMPGPAIAARSLARKGGSLASRCPTPAVSAAARGAERSTDSSWRADEAAAPVPR
jgi:hypothetical protein